MSKPSEGAMEIAREVCWFPHSEGCMVPGGPCSCGSERDYSEAALSIDALVQRKVEEERERQKKDYRDFAEVLRRHWTFGEWQNHTHSWHDREDFIEKHLPGLIAALRTPPPTTGG